MGFTAVGGADILTQIDLSQNLVLRLAIMAGHRGPRYIDKLAERALGLVDRFVKKPTE